MKSGASVNILGDGGIGVLGLVENRKPHGGNGISGSLHNRGITA